ncbi:tRNA-splicing endonuclease subunit Sen34 isoform X2 [Mesoplodon densirostris]|uniref:tRNA-splicing endonuclease subunit Sen34 isoform X2 n=1 Tax=Mesoplodon densirostris TaxID=48708 RepID=UPI0028DCC716|nr:tRNA-splicing endonuclease subunit Sen34 isoform X2 [Mesoplodon densirostris]
MDLSKGAWPVLGQALLRGAWAGMAVLAQTRMLTAGSETPQRGPAPRFGAGPRLCQPRGLAGSPEGGVWRPGGGAWPSRSAGGERGTERGSDPRDSGAGLRRDHPPPRRWEASLRRESGGERRAGLWVTPVPLASRRRMLVVEVANGRSLVWGAEAVQALRERLGVGGRTVGALPRGPRQNSRLGLPLLLMPEEARLLAEIGAVTLVSAPRPDPRQHSLALASFKRQQEQGFQEQSALAAEARETRRQELLEKIAEGQAAKKQKLEQKSGTSGSQDAGGNQAAEENEASAGQAAGEHEEAGSSPPQPGPSNAAAPLPRSALLIQLATARPRPIKARPLDWRVQSKDWPHAGRPAHELRYSIYRDLWERGFFLSAAGKFGGDFLVYPGDPLRFHAHYIAQCWAPGDPIPLQDLVSAGRLGTSVRKTLLLCSPQPDGKVVYTSLQWASLQ